MFQVVEPALAPALKSIDPLPDKLTLPEVLITEVFDPAVPEPINAIIPPETETFEKVPVKADPLDVASRIPALPVLTIAKVPLAEVNAPES